MQSEIDTLNKQIILLLAKVDELQGKLNKNTEEYWYMRDGGNIDYSPKAFSITERHKDIGNYFKTQDEAELAVKKLKAWKRLKDAGFKFEMLQVDYDDSGDFIDGKAQFKTKIYDGVGTYADLRLVFGEDG